MITARVPVDGPGILAINANQAEHLGQWMKAAALWAMAASAETDAIRQGMYIDRARIANMCVNTPKHMPHMDE